MSNEFLGHVIKSDRESIGLTQYELQRRSKVLSILRDSRLSEDEKEQLLKSRGNAIENERGWVFCSFPSTLISKIERGVARSILEGDLSIIAEVLGQDLSRYSGLEVNPVRLIGSKVAESEVVQAPFIERSIVFDAEYRQAGVSILNFFSEIVEREFSNQSVKVGIMQSGNSVTLRIETPDGKVLKEVEQKLNAYGMAVMGKAPIESISKDQVLLQELKTRLEVTNLELRLRQEASCERSLQYESRIVNLESQISNLHNLVGQGLTHQTSLIETIKNLSASDSQSNNFLLALEKVSQIVGGEKTAASERNLNASLNVLEVESPGILSRLSKTLEAMPAGILGNMLTPWVQTIILSIPK
ncbi:hypothetical protein [Pseudomonas sp.]|uniref:hypothetical protein n=1 Tax=Pseudomonas sp. TaxID=306 RepID=UPI002736C77F|nr:hypothetical protein [Pseudomonas sp.]MDP2746314.1 hypothetical protein [Pseudomonas sp.]